MEGNQSGRGDVDATQSNSNNTAAVRNCGSHYAASSSRNNNLPPTRDNATTNPPAPSAERNDVEAPRRRSSRIAADGKKSYNDQDKDDGDYCNSNSGDDDYKGEATTEEVDDDDSLSGLNVKDLKEKCRERGIKIGDGKKAQLLARLRGMLSDDDDDDDEDDDPLSSLTAEQRKEYLQELKHSMLNGMCKKLQVTTGGSKREIIDRILSHYSDDEENQPGQGYMYTNKPDGSPLYIDRQNTKLSNKEYIQRSKALMGCSQIPVKESEWDQFCEDENLGVGGRALKRWYNQGPVLCDNETDFHLRALKYWGMTPFEIGKICQKFSDFCHEQTGQRRIVLPGVGSCVLKALYDAEMYDEYCFLRAIILLRGFIADSNSSSQKGKRATWVMSYLQKNCYLVEVEDKLDARHAMIGEDSNMNVLFLGFCGLEEEDFPEDLGVYPDVDETRESYDSVVNSEYLVESTTIALCASKQGDDIVRVESDPKLLAIVESSSKKSRLHHRHAVALLMALGQCCSGCLPHSSSSATRPVPGSCAELHPILRELIATIDHNGPFAVFLKHDCFGGKSPTECSIGEMTLQIALCIACNWMSMNDNYNIDFNLFRQALPKQCRDRVEINNCSIDLPCPSSHRQKDCSKTTREIAGKSIAAGGNRMRRLHQKLLNEIKMKAGCKFTGTRCSKEEDASRFSFHHPAGTCPIALKHASSNIELLVDAKKESQVSNLKLFAMTSAKNKEEQAVGARELAVTVPVIENKHRVHHAIDDLRRDRSLVTVEEYYCDWQKDGLCVVDAAKSPEFNDLFDMAHADELSEKPLRVVVKVVNGRPISMSPVVINRDLHDDCHIAFVYALFKMMKVDKKEKVDLRRVIETLTADCPNAVVQTDRGVEIPVASVSPDILSRWSKSNSTNDTTEDQSSNDIAPVASTTTQNTELSESRTFTPKPGCVILVSEEGEPFEVPMGIAIQSNYVKEKLEEGGTNGSRVVHLPYVKTAILERVVVFLCLDRDEPFSMFAANFTTDFDEAFHETWRKFARMPQIDMCHLIIAAEILGIKELTDLTCAAVGSAFDGKSPEQVAKIINEKIPFVGKGDDETFNYTWELQPSGGYRSTNLGMSTRRSVNQEGSVIVGLLEDLRDEDDDTSGVSLANHAVDASSASSSDVMIDNGASTSSSGGDVTITVDSGDLEGELNVDESLSASSGGEDASLTAGESELINDEVKVTEEFESTYSVMDDESVGRDNSADADADADADGKENVNVEKIRKRDDLDSDSDEDRSDAKDCNTKRRKSTHVPAQPIDEDCASIANAFPPPAQHIEESPTSVANANEVQQDGLYRLRTDRRLFRYRPLNPITVPLQNREGRGFVSPKPNHRSNNA